MESSGLVSSSSGGASITVKGESTSSSSSSNKVLTGGKTFAELTEEEKRRILEIQRKDEEESKSQWGDGAYEKKVRYQNSKSESTVITGGAGRTGGGNSEALAGSTSSVTNRGPKFTVGLSETGGVVLNEHSSSKSESTVVTGNGRAQSGGYSGTSGTSSSSATNAVNRGPTFTVGSYETSGGAVRNEHESRGTSSSGSTIYTGSSQGSTSWNAGAAGHGGAEGGSSTIRGGAGVRHDDHSHYGSTDGVYGAAHFAETAESSSSGVNVAGKDFRGGSSSSSAHRESSGGNFAAAGGTSQFGGGSTYRESSVSMEKTETRFGSESEAARRGGSASSSMNFGSGSSSSSNTGSDFRGWSLSGNSSHVAGEQSGSWGTSGEQSHGNNKWSYENRDGAGRTANANQGSVGGAGWQYSSAGAGLQGGKNFTSFHESQNSHVVNTTWDDRGPPKTYVKNQWRTNDDGYVRNGSSTHVEDGLLDYRETVRRMNTGGVNVVSNIPGDDSDLSVTASSGRQDQGFRQAKVDETVTVQKWRTVDGKLYRVNNADDWNALTAREGSTEVYEAQDYYPQDYRKPAVAQNGGSDKAQDVDGKFKLYTRFKRDTATKKCGPTRCATVKCKIGPLSKDQEVWLSFRSRAWVNTLKKVKHNSSGHNHSGWGEGGSTCIF